MFGGVLPQIPTLFEQWRTFRHLTPTVNKDIGISDPGGSGDGDAPERRWIRDHRVSNGDDDIDGSSDHSATARGAVLKILLGVGLGFLLFTNQDARQITADLLRATGDAIAPADEDRTLEDRINEVLAGD